MQTQLFISGEFRAAASGKTFSVENPATEETLAQVADAGGADVDAAVSAARACFESEAYRRLSARARGKLLLRLADALESHREDLARLESLQNGKPIFEAQIELAMTAEVFRYYGGYADKIFGQTLPVEGNALAYTLREPVGVVAAIVPWNFPLNLASWKLAPALAAGCTVVLKPAPETPLTALALAELAREVGFPPGALNVVCGGIEAGQALVRHPGVDKIAFTGSTATGRWIAREAAADNKRVTLELGGKSPNVIFADADLQAAIRGAQNGIFYGKGEVCCAGSRLLVERSVHDQVVEGLVKGAARRVPGDPLDKKTLLGALVSRRQQAKVLGYIQQGKVDGATLVAGGKAATVGGKGCFVEATVFDGVTAEMTIAQEEIFGPVLSVMTFDSVEEGLALANRTIYGLAAGIWTRDVGKALRAARAVRAGTVWVNTYNNFDPGAPFGGFKASGYGRDLGPDALAGYLETKTVWVNLG